MFEIEYSLADNFSADFLKAEQADLRYSLFLGSINFKHGNKKIVMDWDWIPLLDFALCLSAICKHLAPVFEGVEEFEFTESDEKIIFHKNGELLEITTSFSNDTLESGFKEFCQAVRGFYKNILFEIVSKAKSLANNEHFAAYLKDVDDL